LAGGEDFSNESQAYPGQLRQIITDYGLGDAVTFLGEANTQTLLKEYAQCSVVVLSSVLETAPMVIMEAMAAGIPVVSTDAGGSRHLIKSGQTGLIVPVDDTHALAQGLRQVLGNKETMAKMSSLAQEAAYKRFHARVIASKTRDVYCSMMGLDH